MNTDENIEKIRDTRVQKTLLYVRCEYQVKE